jgi:7-cyano-7-deazaguanine synthase
MRKAVVLLSGGIDSATTLYYARSKGYKTHCLTFDYGQRHKKEIRYAKQIARLTASGWRLIKIHLPWKGSALLDRKINLPKSSRKKSSIPSTYVPGRNIIFLVYAVSYAEATGAEKIFIGANQIDYSGYPDCRGPFIRALDYAINKGTKCGSQGRKIKIEAPLLNKTKKDIIKMAAKLGVPFKHTWSCYKGAKRPCGVCDACFIRRRGFEMAGHKDPHGV